MLSTSVPALRQVQYPDRPEVSPFQPASGAHAWCPDRISHQALVMANDERWRCLVHTSGGVQAAPTSLQYPTTTILPPNPLPQSTWPLVGRDPSGLVGHAQKGRVGSGLVKRIRAGKDHLRREWGGYLVLFEAGGSCITENRQRGSTRPGYPLLGLCRQVGKGKG